MNVRQALEYHAAWQRILAIVCVFALLFNNVLLIASAEEQSVQTVLVCDKEEHKHTDACYQEIVVCGMEEEPPEYRFMGTFKPHMHTPECFDKNDNVVCGYVENAYIHAHNEYCYDANGNLVCGLKEIAPHIHGESCYDEEGKLICEKPDASHKHTESCYDDKGNLVCGLQEVEEFITKKSDWTATGHTHVDSCYAMKLVCGKEEHTHTAECYATIQVETEPEQKEAPVTEPESAPADAEIVEDIDVTNEPAGEIVPEEPVSGQDAEPEVNDNTDEEEENIDLTGEEPATEAEDAPAVNEPQEDPVIDTPADEEIEEDIDLEDEPEDAPAAPVEPAEVAEDTREENPAVEGEEPSNEHTEPVEDAHAPVKDSADNNHAEAENPVGNNDTVTDGTDSVDLQVEDDPEMEETTPASDIADDEAAEETPDNDNAAEETSEDIIVEDDNDHADDAVSENDPENDDGEGTVAEETVDLSEEQEDAQPEDQSEGKQVNPAEYPSDDPAEESQGAESTSEESVPESQEEQPAEPELVYELETETLYHVKIQSEEPNGFQAGTQIQVLENAQPSVEPRELRVLPADTTGNVVVYSHTLDINLILGSDAAIINEDARYKVAIDLPDLHGITVLRVYKGEELLSSTANNRGVVTFYTNGFGTFTFLAEVSESDHKTTENMDTAIYGETNYVHINSVKAPKGLSVIEAIGAEANANAWIRIRATNIPELAPGASLSLYSVEEGSLDSVLRENVTTEDALLVNLGKYTGFALVMDCGFSQRTETTGDVTLYGMLPNNTVLAVNDVREACASFAPVKNRNTEILAAYDIAFVGNGEELQPTGTVKVTMQNPAVADAILQGRDVRLWHIEDDGTVTEIPDFGRGENGEVIFYAKGFSVYAITATIDNYTGSYEFSLTGDGTVRVAELLNSLGLNMESLYAFADGEYPEIGTPVISNTEVLELTQGTEEAQSEWVLRRVAPLETQETITIPVSNGDSIVIALTDEPVKQVVMEAVSDIYRVTAEYDQRACLPEGTVLVVSDVSGEGYEEDAADALGLEEGEQLLYAKTLDISFVYNGEVIEPKYEVKISVELNDLDHGLDSMRVVHFAENGAEEIENNINNNEITFASDSFSRYTFGTVLKTLAEEKDEQGSISLMAFKEQTIQIEQPEASLEEGLEVMKAVGITGAEENEPLYVKAEWETPENPMESLYLGDLTKNAEVLTAESGDILPLDTTNIAIIKDTGYRRLELTAVANDTEVLLSGMMPRGSEVTAEEVTENFAEFDYTIKNPDPDVEEPPMDKTTVAAFDIAIVPSEEFAEIIGEKYEPDAEHPVHVEITDSRIKENKSYELWHIKDNGERERVDEFEIVDGKIIFDAEEFSIYNIAEVDIRDNSKAQVIEDLRQGAGFKLAITAKAANGTYYPLNVTNTSQANHVLISQTKNVSQATVYYFEENQNGTWNIYWKDANDVKYYIHVDQQYPTKFSFSTTTPSQFYIDLYDNTEGHFYIYQQPNYSFNLKGDGNKGGFQLYPTNNGTNMGSCVELLYANADESGLKDLLDGKSYGLISMRHTESSLAGYALLADNAANANRRKSQSMLVRTDPTDKISMLYVANDIKITFWTFNHERADIFTLSTKIDGITYYLKADTGSKLILTETPDNKSEFRVIPGTGQYKGQLRLYNAATNSTVYLWDTPSEGFGTHNIEISDQSHLYLVERSEYADEDFVMYNADKISVSDPNLHTGDQVVLYTRVWDGEKYEFFVVDHDGTLIRAFEDGGTLTWVGRYINTAVWDFTEYTYEGTNDPNYYYELQNTYSGKYVAPQVNTNQIFADHPIGINLNGRRYGSYYSKILAWDDPNYDYAGYKADLETGTVQSVPMSHAEDFYFAKIYVEDELTPVKTLQHSDFGITMKMVDFANQNVPNGYLGSMSTAGYKAKTGLLSTDLTNNYPTTTYNGRSFADLYSGGQAVDKLFIENTYYGSGYFQFDSTQNFASLNDDGKTFSVYRELGTIDLPGVRPTVDHGQFMPYNKIYPGRFAINHPINITDIYGDVLSGDSGRTGEKLYKITLEEADYYFGMEMSASFMQLPDGKDAWGHDIIFEFLYVDGELVLDLGGVHSAIGGSINFSTGVVKLPPSASGQPSRTTTLYDVFRTNYMTRNPNATTAEVEDYLNSKFVLRNGTHIFKNYSTHNMRMFYMERGAGASNLKLRFNLTTANPGRVELEKEVSGTDKNDYASAEFPFQIFYELNDGLGCTHLITQELLDDDVFRVVYKNTTEGVRFEQSRTIDGITYNNLFFLKPGQIADITMPPSAVRYKVKECGVNTNIYDTTTINDEAPATQGQGNSNTKWYESTADAPEDRVKVIFENHVDPSALRTLSIKKLLYDESDNLLTAQDDPTGFRFRMYLGEDLDYYRMGEYHVKDPDGYYCVYNGGFVSTGVAVFENLTAEQQLRATFRTSPSGAIDRIPSEYTVEIRGLLVGTKFKVEERVSDLPRGYSYRVFTEEVGGVPTEFVCYRRVEGSYIVEPGYDINSGVIRDNSDPALEIHNRRGWGLSGVKIWSDKDFMAEHGDIYFAVYCGTDMVPGTLRKVINNSVYYYLGDMGQGQTFDDYKIREVLVTGPIVTDAEGYVTSYGTATMLDTDDIIEVSDCRQTGSSTYAMLPYSVSYETGASNGVSGHENVREDRVTNTRPDGLRIMKYDWSGNPLENAQFTLKKGDAMIGTYTSDDRGWVTTAYLEDGSYSLEEILSPVGYQGLTTPIEFTIQGRNVTITQNPEWVSVENLSRDGNGLITINVKNRPVTFKVYKKNPLNNPLAGAHFALYKQRVSTSGQLVKDFAPMEGYEDIVSQADGELPGLDESLPKGVYYLTEKQAPATYAVLSQDLCFEIDDLGYIRKISGPGTLVQQTEQTGTMDVFYTINVENELLVTDGVMIRKVVTGDMGDKQKDFTFTIVQAPAGQKYTWEKNGVQQPLQIGMGDTFTLKHGETVQIFVPDETLLRISEANGQYNTTWVLNGEELNADQNNTVGFSDVGLLVVTNDYGTVAPTSYNGGSATVMFVIVLINGAILWILTKKRSKNN